MIKTEQATVLKIQGVYSNAKLEKGDNFTFTWDMRTDSFKSYIKNVEMEEEQREYLNSMDEWEIDCKIVNWTNDSIIVTLDQSTLIIPFNDIAKAYC